MRRYTVWRWLALRRALGRLPVRAVGGSLVLQAVLVLLLVLAPHSAVEPALALGLPAASATLGVSASTAPALTAAAASPTPTATATATPGREATAALAGASFVAGASVVNASTAATNSTTASTADSADPATTTTSTTSAAKTTSAAPRPSPSATPTATATPAPTATPKPQSPYRLPWPGGETFSVVQGNNGAFSHKGLEAYAWDFVMPTGSVVEAARGGVVRFVRDDSNAGGGQIDEDGDASNYVVIDHGDGTSGLYMHLMYHGVLVQPGEKVSQGQPIAYSGGTGFATGPHLHFMVEQTTGDWYTQSLPIGFADVASNNGVPVQDASFTSGNAKASYWFTNNPVQRVELPPITLPQPVAAPIPGVQGTGQYLWPAAGQLLTPFGPAMPGIDILAPAGSAVVAADTGTVVYAGADPGGVGFTVAIDHGDGAVSLYTRLAQAAVGPRAIVQRGQTIGVAGALAPGLPSFASIAVYQQGQPVDPRALLQGSLPPAPAPQVRMPNLVGMTQAQAQAAIQPFALSLVWDAPQPSTTVAAGLTALQQPPAGALLPIHMAVHVALSAGPPATHTPTPVAPTPTAAAPQPSPTVAKATPAAAPPAAAATPPAAKPSAAVTAAPAATASPKAGREG